MGWVLWVRAADIGDLEHHVGRSVCFPERDADVLHAVSYTHAQLSIRLSELARETRLTAQVRELQKVWVDSNLADEERVIGNATGTLIRVVVLTSKGISRSRGSVQLPCVEEIHVPMIETVERKINRSSAINVRRKLVCHWRLSHQDSSAI